MSEFVEVKTCELIGQALDWAVAMAEFWEEDRPQDGQIRKGDACMLVGPFRLIGLGADKFYSPSTNWAQGGPLIEKYEVRLNITTDGEWHASTDGYILGVDPSSKNQSPLIASCRAIVGSRRGGVVRVPSGLVIVK